MLESDPLQYYFVKYGVLLFGLVSIVVFLYLILSPVENLVVADREPMSLEEKLFFLLFGLIFASIGFYLKKKMKFVKLNDDLIELSASGYQRMSSWHEIEKIKMIRWVAPPYIPSSFLTKAPSICS